MLFEEPSLEDLNTIWSANPTLFLTEKWGSTEHTCAQWAWLIDGGTFWTDKHVTNCDKKSLPGWDWVLGKVHGKKLVIAIDALLGLNIAPSGASLTKYLMQYDKNTNSKKTTSVLKAVMHRLVSQESVSYEGSLGESAIAALCVIGEPVLLRLYLNEVTTKKINWDIPNKKQSVYFPLHFAVANMWAGGVAELVKAGANEKALSKYQQTYVDLAEDSGWYGYKNTANKLDVSKVKSITPAKKNAEPSEKKKYSTQLDFF